MFDVSDIPYSRFSHRIKMMFSFLWAWKKGIAFIYVCVTAIWNVFWRLTRIFAALECQVNIRQRTLSKWARGRHFSACLPLGSDPDIDSILIRRMTIPSGMYRFGRWTVILTVFDVLQLTRSHTRCHPVRKTPTYYPYVWHKRTRDFYSRRNVHDTLNTQLWWVCAQNKDSIWIACLPKEMWIKIKRVFINWIANHARPVLRSNEANKRWFWMDAARLIDACPHLQPL